MLPLSKYRPTIATEASERLEIAAEALGRMGAVRCARCGHRVSWRLFCAVDLGR